MANGILDLISASRLYDSYSLYADHELCSLKDIEPYEEARGCLRRSIIYSQYASDLKYNEDNKSPWIWRLKFKPRLMRMPLMAVLSFTHMGLLLSSWAFMG